MPKGYLCCLCSKGIQRHEEETSVALAALNMRDWLEDVPKPRDTMMWAHFECLSEAWPGPESWEASALIEPVK